MSPAKKPALEINEDTLLEEIGTLVCTRLEADGISIVRSGGAAAEQACFGSCIQRIA